jgi:hypothetical protein
MKPIFLKNYGEILTENAVADQICETIKKLLEIEYVVGIDLSGVKTMTTVFSKRLFGKLYIDLNGTYFEKIKVMNHNEDLAILIRVGIEGALDEQEDQRKKNTVKAPTEKIKVYSEDDENYVQIPVTVFVKIYLPEDFNPAAVTVHDVRNQFRHLERIDLGELVLEQLDENNVERERPKPDFKKL